MQTYLAVLEKKENSETPKESLTELLCICRYFYNNTSLETDLPYNPF